MDASPRPPRRIRTDNHEFKVVRLRELSAALPYCDSPERVYQYWQSNIVTAPWYNPEVECLCVIHLNTRRRATGFHLVGIGTLDSVLITPREVFRTAIVHNAAAIVVAHNHPSGDPTPSDANSWATVSIENQAEPTVFCTSHHFMSPCHSRRDTLAANMAAKGATIEEIAKALGQKGTSATQAYIRRQGTTKVASSARA